MYITFVYVYSKAPYILFQLYIDIFTLQKCWFMIMAAMLFFVSTSQSLAGLLHIRSTRDKDTLSTAYLVKSIRP